MQEDIEMKSSLITGYERTGYEQVDELARQVARRAMVKESMALVFTDFTETLAELFRFTNKWGEEVLVAGHASPDVAIAVDRAELRLTEVLGSSPFCDDSARVLAAISRGDETLYLANPNRVTGANYSLSDLDTMARAVPRGALILDEYYFDFYGITGIPLLQRFTNVMIVRSFTTGFGISSNESGYLVAEPEVIAHFRKAFEWSRVSNTESKIAMTSLANDMVQTRRLKVLHEESLRLAMALTRLGIQNRITPTDFLLLRVADPKRVGDCLASRRVAIKNLDGYPELKHYIAYVVQSEYSNDNFLNAFRRMPAEYYRMKTIDRRAIVLRGHAQERPKHEAAGDQVKALEKNRLPLEQDRTVIVDTRDL